MGQIVQLILYCTGKKANMLRIVQANGFALETDMTKEEFMQAIADASPSPWIVITETTLGSVTLNTFCIAYIKEL